MAQERCRQRGSGGRHAWIASICDAVMAFPAAQLAGRQAGRQARLCRRDDSGSRHASSCFVAGALGQVGLCSTPATWTRLKVEAAKLGANRAWPKLSCGLMCARCVAAGARAGASAHRHRQRHAPLRSDDSCSDLGSASHRIASGRRCHTQQ